MSNQSFHRYTRLVIVCPVASKIKDYPMRVRLDGRTKIQGEALCEHVKSLDPQARGATCVDRLPDDILADALERIHLAIE